MHFYNPKRRKKKYRIIYNVAANRIANNAAKHANGIFLKERNNGENNEQKVIFPRQSDRNYDLDSVSLLRSFL